MSTATATLAVPGAFTNADLDALDVDNDDEAAAAYAGCDPTPDEDDEDLDEEDGNDDQYWHDRAADEAADAWYESSYGHGDWTAFDE